MLKILFCQILLLCFISLNNAASFSWDPSTNYAHFYNIDEGKATKNSLDSMAYMITSYQTVPEGVTKISIRINSYG